MSESRRKSGFWATPVIAAIGLLALMPQAIAADAAALLGRWHLIDDETGTERGVIELTEANGTVQGRLVSGVARPGESPLCVKCEGERKNQPIVGMVILWGLKADGADWDGGKILDPAKGQIYNAKATLSDDGRALKVRGYVGLSLFGRTQVWLRDK